jgi:hemolysin activation/secretion protein
VTYGFPVNSWGGRLNLGYYKDDTAIKNGSLASLNITGKSLAQTALFRQPTFVDSSSQIDVVVGGKKRSSRNWIDSVFLSRTDTSDRSLGLEGQLFNQRGNWSASYVRSFLRADTTESESFVVDRGSLRHNRELPYDLSLRGSLSWQSTHQVLLPSSEQFFIGGEGSVRGYPVGVYGGDTGQVINLELHHPLFTASEATNNVGATGFFFADYGRVKPFRPPNSRLSEHNDLTGVGWGMHATLGKKVYARLTFGYGLDRVPLQPRSYEINFQLIASAF